jgi:electron transport complex protein RnfE
MKLWPVFYKGLFEMNPIFRLALSLCPSLAVSSTLIDSIAMGLVVTFVITMNNISVSIFKNFINPKVRVPVYITSIATIVTVTQLVLQAYFPDIYASLGIYLPLVVVFAIILARAEVFAAKNTLVPSAIDGLGMGVGFLGAMMLIGSIRELIGMGSLGGVEILNPILQATFSVSYDPVLIMILSPGAFMLIGLLIGLFNIIGVNQDKEADKKRFEERMRKLAAQREGVSANG